MSTLRPILGIVICSVLMTALMMGCHDSSIPFIPNGWPDPGPIPIPPPTPPYNTGTVMPAYGPVSGGNNVVVVLPEDFEWVPGSSKVYFVDDSSGSKPAKAKKLSIDLVNFPWFLNCVTPPSPSGDKAVVDVVLTTGDEGGMGSSWPPPDSVVLRNAYTYIDPVQELDFLARRVYPFGIMWDISPTDYNGDGWVDLVGLDNLHNALIFAENDGQGGFVLDKVRPIENAHPNGPHYSALVAGNVNGDALDDIVVVGQLGFMLLTNNPSTPGTFTARLSNAFRRGICGTLADLNLDGYGDLIIGGTDAVRIFGYIPKIGMFTSHPVQLDTTMKILGVQVADIDNDVDLDIISITHDRLIWYLNENPGKYGPAKMKSTEPVSDSSGVRRILIADLNEDGNQDVIFTSADLDESWDPYPEGLVSVALGDGLGNFNTPFNYPVSGVGHGLSGATDLEAIDVDMDGFLDVMVTAAGRSAALMFKGDGTGKLTPFGSYGVGENALYLAALDADKDGVTDLAVSEPGSKTFSLLEGTQGGGGDGRMEGCYFQCGFDLQLDIHPSMVQAVDLDSDHLTDLVVMNIRTGRISVLLNTGVGQFIPYVDFPVSGDRLESFCIFQANEEEDSCCDLAVLASNDQDPGTLSIFLGDGTGLFSVSQILKTTPRPMLICQGNVNNKKGLELVVIQAGQESCTIYRRDGFGKFKTFANRKPLPGLTGLTLSDLDNDFDLDGVLPSPDYGALYLLPTEKKAFGILAIVSNKTNYPVQANPTIVDVGDFNLDGRPDLVFNSRDASCVTVAYGDGFLNFIENAPIDLTRPASSLLALDINFDYQSDLCAISPSQSGLDVVLNHDGVLSKTVDSPLPVNGFDLQANLLWVDLNGDVLPDLVIPSQREKKITILFNTSK